MRQDDTPISIGMDTSRAYSHSPKAARGRSRPWSSGFAIVLANPPRPGRRLSRTAHTKDRRAQDRARADRCPIHNTSQSPIARRGGPSSKTADTIQTPAQGPSRPPTPKHTLRRSTLLRPHCQTARKAKGRCALRRIFPPPSNRGRLRYPPKQGLRASQGSPKLRYVPSVSSCRPLSGFSAFRR